MRNRLLTTAIIALLPTITFAADVDTIEVQPIEPNWSITVGAMYLVRESSGNGDLFRDGGLGTPVVASANDLDSHGTFGLDISARGNVLGTGVEIRGMWAQPDKTSWSNPNALGTSGGFSVGSLDLFGFGAFGGDGRFALEAKRETTFASLEANVDLGEIEKIDIFAGVRGFWMNDDLFLNIDSTPNIVGPGFNTSLDVDVSNRLIGPQIGVSTKFDSLSNSVFELEGFAKLGYMRVRSDADIVNGGNIVPTIVKTSDKDSFWTTMVEVGINGVIHVTGNMDIKLGYQALYFNELGDSIATLNNSVVNPNNTLNTKIGTESVLYHAANIAAVWKF